MAEERAELLVSGGLLVSGHGINHSDVLVSGGCVVEVAPDLSRRSVQRVIDASGKYVLPGGIDSHAHPIFVDKMDTFSICAAYGGVTTVIAFIGSETHRHRRYGNAWGVKEYNPDIVKGFIEYAQETSYTDFAVHGLVTMRDRVTIDRVIPDLVHLGVISFKMFMTWNPWAANSPTNELAVPDEVLVRVMDLASHKGGLPMVHAENGCCKAYLEAELRSKGKTSSAHYLESAPNSLEAEAVNRAATMAQITGSALYPVHLSARQVLPILRQFKGEGLSLFAETCPHYLTLTNDDLLERGYRLKVAPPLREAKDRDAMWEGIADGAIDTIGSDFTGYTRVLKLTGELEGEAKEPQPGQENIFEVAASRCPGSCSSSARTRPRSSACTRAPIIVGVGHGAPLVVVAASLLALGAFVPLTWVRLFSALVLLSFGAYKLLRCYRHPRWVGMQVNPRDLFVWSFILASAHRAGLMLAPILLDVRKVAASAHPLEDIAPHAGYLGLADTSAAWGIGMGVHTAAMLLVMFPVALIVYKKIGLALPARLDKYRPVLGSGPDSSGSLDRITRLHLTS